jgi:hypothetical protein
VMPPEAYHCRNGCGWNSSTQNSVVAVVAFVALLELDSRVALQRCPILRSGDLILPQGLHLVYDVVQLTQNPKTVPSGT